MLSIEPYIDADFGKAQQTPAIIKAASQIPTKKEITSYADLQGEMVYVQPGNDPFNNAVSFSSHDKQRYEMAEMMPDGFDDTFCQRQALLDQNPRDDNALLAPRRDEIEEYLDATSDLRRRQILSQPTGNRHLGTRSLLWPPLDDLEDCDDGRTSYATYTSGSDFDQHAQEACKRSTMASVFQ
jgi:hypothetical protein